MKVIGILSFIPVFAFAFNHSEDFGLYPEADLICSNDAALIAIDDDAQALGVGERGASELLPISVSVFKKTAAFDYQIIGLLQLPGFAAKKGGKAIRYTIKVIPGTTAGTATVEFEDQKGAKNVSEALECERRS